MKTLQNLALPKRLYATSNSKNYLSQLVNARMVGLSSLSGYPLASYVVGRIQKSINLDSMKSLLESIKELRDMTKLASDILYTAPLGRIDKQQFVRTELIAYVDTQSRMLGYATLTDDQKDLIAYMIASSEAPDNAWLLDLQPRAAENRIVKLHNLYASLLASKGRVTIKDNKIVTSNQENLYVYVPYEQTISHLSNSKRVRQLQTILEMSSNVAGAKIETVKSKIVQDYNDLTTVTLISHLRVLDHVTSLLTTTDIWGHFISPRMKSDAASNIERAQSLQLLASYLHALLAHHQQMTIEALRQGFDAVRDNFLKFPELPAHIVSSFKKTVTDRDVLNASQDIRDWFASFSDIKLPNHDSSVQILPAESVRISGIEDLMTLAQEKASSIKTPLPLTELGMLGKDPAYTYIMLAQPIAMFRIPQDVIDSILLTDKVEREHTEAMAAIEPGMDLYMPHDILEKLRKLNLRPNMSMVNKQPAYVDPVTAHTNTYNGSRITMKSYNPIMSRATRSKARKDLLYTINTSSKLVRDLKDGVTDVIHRDVIDKRLQVSLGKEWKTLMPAQWFIADDKYDTASLAASDGLRKRLFESMFQQHFVMLERHLDLDSASRLFATYISAFASMYVMGNDPLDIKSFDPSSGLVIGYGKPYGVDYTALASKQPEVVDANELIKITDTTFIRFHKRVPLPTRELLVQPDLQVDIPYYYYAGNSELMDVSNWVLVAGLPHLALAPQIVQHCDNPIVFTDKRYAYLGDAVMIQDHMLWTPKFDDGDIESTSISLAHQDWKRGRFLSAVEYYHFGAYGVQPTVDVTETVHSDQDKISEMIQNATKEIEEIEKSAPANNTDKANADSMSKVEATKLESSSSKDKDSKTSKNQKPVHKKKDGKQDEEEDNDDESQNSGEMTNK